MSGLLKKLRQFGIECVEPNAYEGLEQIEDIENQEVSYPVIEDPNPRMMWLEVVEESRPKQPVFRYFVDGSARTMNVGHMIDMKDRCLPMYAAQIAVAATQLDEKEIALEKHLPRTILFIPMSFAAEDVESAKNVIAEANQTSRAPIKFELETYPIDKNEKPIDQARKKILQTMHSMEVSMITELVDKGKVNTNEKLVIDGSLQFYQGLDRNLAAFKNVVGVAKSFDLHKSLGKGRKKQDVGAIVARLRDKHRTPAHGIKSRNLTIASWYLRIHALKSIHGLQMAEVVSRQVV